MSALHFEGKRHESSAKHPLDLTILGVSSGSGLNGLDYALVRYHQKAPAAPLQVELLQVSLTIFIHVLLLTATVQ